MCGIFLVEDEALIKVMTADMVEQPGHRVIAGIGSLDVARPPAQFAKFDLLHFRLTFVGASLP